MTSPIAGEGGPIPFSLSPQAGPVSPFSKGWCSSSPDLNSNNRDLTDDSFSQAFTSIKTTDSSANSSSCHFLESLETSDGHMVVLETSLKYVNSTNQSPDSLKDTSLASCPSINTSSKFSPELSDKENVSPSIGERDSLKAPAQNLKDVTPPSKISNAKRTRFHSAVRSYSSNLEQQFPLKMVDSLPGRLYLFLYWL